jgi:Lrp/AsnC family leucine-responsive transcriptional regulator
MNIDHIDKKILELIQRDAGLTCAEIGTRIHLSGSSVNDRMRRLRARGVIRRMSAEIDPAAFGLDLLAFVLVVVEREENAFRDLMAGRPEVLECHHVTGDYSYLLKLRLANAAGLERFLAETLKALPGVTRTHTLIALSSVKETHVLSGHPNEGAPA